MSSGETLEDVMRKVAMVDVLQMPWICGFTPIFVLSGIGRLHMKYSSIKDLTCLERKKLSYIRKTVSHI